MQPVLQWIWGNWATVASHTRVEEQEWKSLEWEKWGDDDVGEGGGEYPPKEEGRECSIEIHRIGFISIDSNHGGIFKIEHKREEGLQVKSVLWHELVSAFSCQNVTRAEWQCRLCGLLQRHKAVHYKALRAHGRAGTELGGALWAEVEAPCPAELPDRGQEHRPAGHCEEAGGGGGGGEALPGEVRQHRQERDEHVRVNVLQGAEQHGPDGEKETVPFLLAFKIPHWTTYPFCQVTIIAAKLSQSIIILWQTRPVEAQDGGGEPAGHGGHLQHPDHQRAEHTLRLLSGHKCRHSKCSSQQQVNLM